jgi:S-adenosylmethionine:tRNA ribosyltransferase-isomerase
MQLSDFSFDLPDELIARYPLDSRSASRLLHIDAQGQYHDHVFTDILDLLEEGDLLVLNDTKVMKARLKGKRATGGAIEVLVERMWTPTLHIAISNQVTHLKQAQNCISVKMPFLSRYKVAMKICLW